MKRKIIWIVLSVLCLGLCGCRGGQPKMGLGVVSRRESVQSAEGDRMGQAVFATTAAAVVLDADGKITGCKLDAADITLPFTAAGKAQKIGSSASKKELGEAYGMAEFAPSGKEWHEQAAAFEKLVLGKTIKEVKGLAAAGGKGNADVIAAGCTVSVSDFITAIERAEKSAVVCSGLGENPEPSLQIQTEQSVMKDALGGKGESGITQTVRATLPGGQPLGEQITGSVTFDGNGMSTDKMSELNGKRITK